MRARALLVAADVCCGDVALVVVVCVVVAGCVVAGCGVADACCSGSVARVVRDISAVAAVATVSAVSARAVSVAVPAAAECVADVAAYSVAAAERMDAVVHSQHSPDSRYRRVRPAAVAASCSLPTYRAPWTAASWRCTRSGIRLAASPYELYRWSYRRI